MSPKDNTIAVLKQQLALAEKRAENYKRDGEATSKELFKALNEQTMLAEENEKLELDNQQLRAQNQVFQGSNNTLTAQVAKIEAEKVKQVTKLKESRTALEQEFDTLNGKYDEVVVHRDRALVRYQADYAKWTRFRSWFFVEKDGKKTIRNRRDGEGPSSEASRQAGKERLVAEDPDLGILELDGDSFLNEPVPGIERSAVLAASAEKENGRSVKREVGPGELPAEAFPQPFMGPPKTPSRQKINLNIPSRSPLAALRLVDVPGPQSPSKKRRRVVEEIPMGSLFESDDLDMIPHPTSSASLTEEESQMQSLADLRAAAPPPLYRRLQVLPGMPTLPSSKTAVNPTPKAIAKSVVSNVDETTPKAVKPKATKLTKVATPEPIDVDAFVFTPSVKAKGKTKNGKRKREDKDRRRSDIHQLPSRAQSIDDSRPKKLRKVQSDDEGVGSLAQPVAFGIRQPVPSAPRQPAASGSRLPAKPAAGGTIDYSMYKGRGRYGTKVQGSSSTNEPTINAEYEINPENNGGLAYQFDAVVRTKQDRRQMDAGDCECCHDYYEAIGPLPPRLERPLWRSPTSSQDTVPVVVAARPCQKKGKKNVDPDIEIDEEEGILRQLHVDRDAAAVAKHKQAVSRHRHTWARPKTPPGYWNIGFPSTQEVEGINQEAKVMRKEKKQRVEMEAKRDTGKYKKRN